jgi:hypothetical protein
LRIRQDRIMIRPNAQTWVRLTGPYRPIRQLGVG